MIGAFSSKAQTYGNEWINYSQDYAKFGVYEQGIYRISRSQLLSAGIVNPNGAQLQLFRDGVQQPIFSSASGNLGSSDYIEFYGRPGDGEVDKALFKDPAVQMNPDQNLISDTAYYFITQSTGGVHLRYSVATNNLSGAPAKENYVWGKAVRNYRGALSQGPSYIGAANGLYFRSSQFEKAEGWVHSFSQNPRNFSFSMANAFKGTGAPSPTIETTVAGFSYISTHRIKIEVGSTLLADQTFSSFSSKDITMNLPVSSIPANNTPVFKFTPLNNGSLLDRIGVARMEARYARENDFSGENNVYFELNPKSGNYYLEFDNFNAGGVAPKLYDLAENKVYNGNISVPNKVRFKLPANGQLKQLVLVSGQNGTQAVVSNLKSVSFKNYSNAANQGDYIIITDPHYYDGNGTNYVNEFKNLRSSPLGGGYTAIIAEVNDIYNEFGYGYPFHAQAIRNFLGYSNKSSNWAPSSKFAFLIGKGILYSSYKSFSEGKISNPALYPFVPIPTFGVPASDIMLTDFNNDNSPEMPIGRLSVLNGSEVGVYYNKVRSHEMQQANTLNQYVDTVLWKKSFLHTAGATAISEQTPILSALNRQSNIVGSESIGAMSETYAKSTTGAVQQEATEAIDRALNEGVGFVQYFGHGSSSTLAFGFDRPEQYLPHERFSVFMANGCAVGNVFSTSIAKTLSERWMDVADKGSIAFIANSNTGYLYQLANYTDSFYAQMARESYGKPVGEQFVNHVKQYFSNPSLANNNVARGHVEQMLLQGDPAVSSLHRDKPDYAVEEKYAKIKQISITTQMDSFDVELVAYNLGKYTKDSITLIVDRVLPDNVTSRLYEKRMAGLAITDTINLRVAVGGTNALGLNSLRIKIDEGEEIVEVAEYNNEINKSFLIINDDLEPIYPYEFSIVSEPGVTLKASTLNPFLDTKQYVIQIDTTEFFNSPNLQTTRINSKGGILKWTPTIAYQDSVVYYWRTAKDTVAGNPMHQWTYSSFIYLANAAPGWSQSHYFQYAKDDYENIEINATQRSFNFKKITNKLQMQNVCMEGALPYRYNFADYLTKLNGTTLYSHGCAPSGQYESFQFIIIDSLTGLPWNNTLDPNNPGKGLYGSWKPCRKTVQGVKRDDFFEFSFNTPARRKEIMDFIDLVPDGAYIMMQTRLCLSGRCGGLNNFFIDDMMADTATLGSGNSLYHKIKNLGFTEIDSLYKNRPISMFQQKGIPGTTRQYVGVDSTVKLYSEFEFSSYLYEGKIVSTKIGPAKKWDNFLRQGISKDGTQLGDSVTVEIYGIDRNSNESLIATVKGDTSLSFIDAEQYPCIRLTMNQKDQQFSTPEQVKFWRVHYAPVPEAALNPNVHLTCTDSLLQGQANDVSFAIENLTETDMDSMLVKYSLIDQSSNETVLESIRYQELTGNDTIHANLSIDTKPLSGMYSLKIEANPNEDQPEQYHLNNIGFKEMYVTADNLNPILDVTFDGVHILNNDVVSAKPNILISLKDENNFLPLNDTSAMTLALRYPDATNTVVPISLSDPTVTFIPANTTNGEENKAKLEFRPTFTKDGLYELIVTGKDRMDNQSGALSYKISFEVVTKASVTSVLNYPNPFSTSTQFVFTLTGAEVPEQFKIQVYSVTGKMVREISKQEIGNIHIGRNITNFRWKGDDQYGDKLGNGVYLYRVITRLNGQEMDKAETDPASNWTTKGFGKLYIMR
jgi:flagellar hook assembly protein FlgD